MAATFRSGAHTGYGGAASTSITVTKPTGVAAGDIVVIGLQMEATTKTITPPSGWTLEAEAGVDTGNAIRLYLFWKRMVTADLSATWSFSWTGSAWRTADAVAISGTTTTANPFGGTIGTGTGTTGTRASVAYTTSGAGLGFWIHSQYQDSNAPTLPSGYTSQHSSTEHEWKFATRADSAGSLSSAATTGWAGNHIMMVQTILDADASTGGSVTAVAATATAGAVAPAVTVSASTTAVAATASATALAPTVAGGAGDASVAAVAAAATSLAEPPSVSGTTVLSSGGPAQATAAALAPVVSGAAGSVSVAAVAATATGLAHPPDAAGVITATVVVPTVIATALARVPLVEISDTMFRFEPPTHEEPIKTRVGALDRYTLTYAKTIYRTDAGTFTARRMPPPWLITGTEGVDYFLGGRVYLVGSAVAAELIAAGYSPVPA